MTAKPRVSFAVSTGEHAELKREAKARGLSVAEVARRYAVAGDDLDDPETVDARELADQVARVHYDEHEGPLRFCGRECCRTAHDYGTGVVA